MIIARGVFQGRGDHVLRGTFIIAKQMNGALLTTSDDFFFDGSPAPGWALTKDGVFTKEQARVTDFRRLAQNVPVSGVHTALIPPALDVDQFDSLFLWCFKFPVLLGVGPLDGGG